MLQGQLQRRGRAGEHARKHTINHFTVIPVAGPGFRVPQGRARQVLPHHASGTAVIPAEDLRAHMELREVHAVQAKSRHVPGLGQGSRQHRRTHLQSLRTARDLALQGSIPQGPADLIHAHRHGSPVGAVLQQHKGRIERISLYL